MLYLVSKIIKKKKFCKIKIIVCLNIFLIDILYTIDNLLYWFASDQIKYVLKKNLTSFIGYVKNVVIKLPIYFNSHMRQIMDIIPK
jgi:hypothetical protein